MGRIRTIKPELFRHELLQDLETSHPELRPMLVFQGLMTQADREGRFRWNVRVLRLDILPFLNFDLAQSMDLLAATGLLLRYTVAGNLYGCFPTWQKHQVVNVRERESDIPGPPDSPDADASPTREARVEHASPTPHILVRGEGKGKELEWNMHASPTAAPKTKAVRGTRIHEDFTVTDEHRRIARDEGLPSPDLEVARFIDHWRGKAGKDGVKMDWDATFRNWLRNAKSFGRPAAQTAGFTPSPSRYSEVTGAL